MKNYSILIAFLSLVASLPASATTYTPSSMKMKVYRILISTDPLCTNPIVLWAPSTPTVVDFIAAPTLGNGQVPDGTYQCMIWEISDQVVMTEPTTSGFCTAGTVVTMDVCRPPVTTTGVNGVTTSCVTGEDKMTIYLSTASTGTGGVGFGTPPTKIGDAVNGMNLSGALVISGDSSGTLIFNGAGTLDDTQTGCSGQAPKFGFR